MQKKSNFIITNFYYFVPLGLFLLVAIYISRQYLSSNRKASNKLIVSKGELLKSLQNAWQTGGLDILSKKDNPECLALLSNNQNISDEFYQCNPSYLNCYLSGFNFKGYIPLKLKDQFFEFDKRGNVVITLIKADEYFRVRLFDTCSDVFLPQKKYSAGMKREQNFIWDNFNQNIFVDKYYVSNQDVLLWKQRTGQRITKKEKKLPIAAPYLTLDTELMKKYCYEQGKELLQTHIFDAASFIPNKEDNPKVVKKFPYHWSKRRTFEELECFNVYHKGCESKRSYKFYESMSTSWVGINYVLGNYMEYVLNPFDNNKNLKVSSFYKDEKSHWHEIAARGELGKDNKSTTQKDIEVAFRCMVSK